MRVRPPLSKGPCCSACLRSQATASVPRRAQSHTSQRLTWPEPEPASLMLSLCSPTLSLLPVLSLPLLFSDGPDARSSMPTRRPLGTQSREA